MNKYILENKIINGSEISNDIKNLIKKEINILSNYNYSLPKLVVILVGNNEASKTYVRNKEKACSYVGMRSEIIKFPDTISEEILIKKIEELNHSFNVDGILVQLPLPKHINENKIIQTINPEKDVDGFHPENISKIFIGNNNFIPCTPKGIMKLFDYINCDLNGKHVVIVNRSNIVGKPLSLLFLQKNATVTICHSHTQNLKNICKTADILICAIGKSKFFTTDYIKKDAIIIDVGINRDNNNKLCGDVDFDNVKEIASYITPVPRGVGPMTIAMLLENTMQAYKINMQIEIDLKNELVKNYIK